MGICATPYGPPHFVAFNIYFKWLYVISLRLVLKSSQEKQFHFPYVKSQHAHTRWCFISGQKIMEAAVMRKVTRKKR